jgi:hypothetical protein
MRKESGLRNRFRDGRHSYSRKGKAARRDTYGAYNNGVNTLGENIAGRRVGTCLDETAWPE